MVCDGGSTTQRSSPTSATSWTLSSSIQARRSMSRRIVAIVSVHAIVASHRASPLFSSHRVAARGLEATSWPAPGRGGAGGHELHSLHHGRSRPPPRATRAQESTLRHIRYGTASARHKQPFFPCFRRPPAFIRGAPSAAVDVRCAVSTRAVAAPARRTGRRRRAARPLLLRQRASRRTRRQFRERRAELDGRGAARIAAVRRRRAALRATLPCRTSSTRRGCGARPSCPTLSSSSCWRAASACTATASLRARRSASSRPTSPSAAESSTSLLPPAATALAEELGGDSCDRVRADNIAAT